MIKPGMFIGDRYEIIDKVGSGGMADVYKAKCHKLNRFVAVKIMKSEFSDDGNFISKFRAEAQAAAGLSHPNIVNVYDVGEEDGLYYIVMELVEGITLKDFIDRKGRLDIRESVGIAIQIAQGMEAAHANNIIHRDIKPQNIIISKEGKVKVADFGIAKATTSNTLTSNAMGSVHYISPEQARGGYSDEKSDIYSLGVTMYEMISGQVPFEGDSAVSIALLHIQSEAPTLGEIVPNVPISVDKIVQKCMQKKSERRYLSAGELIADLKHSILEPNVDFVVMSNAMAAGSPTIALSQEDLDAIRNGIVKPQANEPYNDGYMNEQQLMEDNYNGNDNYNNGYDNYNNGYDNNNYDDYNNGYDNQMYQANSDNESVNLDKLDDEDEPSEDTLDPKVEKTAKYIAYALVGILVLVLLYLIYVIITDSGDSSSQETSIAPPTQQADMVTMIDVKGKSFDDAKKAILDDMSGVKEDNIEKKDRETDDSSAIGKVVETNPLKGDAMNKDDKITLYIGVESEGEQVAMPDVKGKKLSKAKEEILSVFPKAQIKSEPEDADGDAKVKDTNPQANIKLSTKFNGEVVIYVQKDDITIPNVVGDTEYNAKLRLAQANVPYNNINVKQESSDQPAGVVIKSDPSAGSTISSKDKVTIYVSKGGSPKNEKVKVSVSKPGELNDPNASANVRVEIWSDDGRNKLKEESKNLKGSDFDWQGKYNMELDVEVPANSSKDKLIKKVFVNDRQVQ